VVTHISVMVQPIGLNVCTIELHPGRVFSPIVGDIFKGIQMQGKLEITCHDGKPDGMSRVERRRYGSAPDVSRGVSDRRPDT